MVQQTIFKVHCCVELVYKIRLELAKLANSNCCTPEEVRMYIIYSLNSYLTCGVLHHFIVGVLAVPPLWSPNQI